MKRIARYIVLVTLITGVLASVTAVALCGGNQGSEKPNEKPHEDCFDNALDDIQVCDDKFDQGSDAHQTCLEIVKQKHKVCQKKSDSE
jgi:hypothetical protein